MSGQFDERGNLWGTAARGTVGKRVIEILVDSWRLELGVDSWRLELGVRGAMKLVQGGFTVEQAAHVLVGISLDELLSEIGAFPDRPLIRGGAR